VRQFRLVWIRPVSVVILAVSFLVTDLSCGEPAGVPRSDAVVSADTSAITAKRVTTVSPSALELLLTDSVFASARVGYAGVPSRQARALRTVLADSRHADLLQQLWHEGTPAGRLYALVGFALTDSVAFQHNARLMASDGRLIPTVMGCIGASERIGWLAREIQGEFATEFRSDSTSARLDALMDSLDARLPRPKPPAS
jgi:hypothetical protein